MSSARCHCRNAEDIAKMRQVIQTHVPKATVIDAASPIRVADPTVIRNKKVLVVEDSAFFRNMLRPLIA